MAASSSHGAPVPVPSLAPSQGVTLEPFRIASFNLQSISFNSAGAAIKSQKDKNIDKVKENIVADISRVVDFAKKDIRGPPSVIPSTFAGMQAIW